MNQMLSLPLTEKDLDRLESLLGAIPGAMNIEEVDGFIAALVCSPDLVMPSVYIPYILSGEDDNFSNLSDYEEFYGLLARHWNTIAYALQQNEPYELLYFQGEDDEPYGNGWALGFMEGMRLGGEGWKTLLYDNQNGGGLVPVLALAHEHDTDPRLRSEPIDRERRELMLGVISHALPKIFQYFEPYRRTANSSSARPRIPFRNRSGKTGRNEPCPCGSNLKYKRCCGRD